MILVVDITSSHSFVVSDFVKSTGSNATNVTNAKSKFATPIVTNGR